MCLIETILPKIFTQLDISRIFNIWLNLFNTITQINVSIEPKSNPVYIG